jgi:hypothetical protein
MREDAATNNVILLKRVFVSGGRRTSEIYQISETNHDQILMCIVYCVSKGMCCNNICDVILLTRECGSRERCTSEISETKHDRTLMCIVYCVSKGMCRVRGDVIRLTTGRSPKTLNPKLCDSRRPGTLIFRSEIHVLRKDMEV